KPTGDKDSNESDPESARRPTGRRRPSGIDVLTEEEQLAVDNVQENKASRKISRSQPHTGGSSEGAGITPEVPDESIDKLTTLSEGSGITPEVLEEAKGSSTAKVDVAIDRGSEEESNWSDNVKID
ncbi:hypothetical protein Tco_0423510, partial [Tanacetum coccineum]